MEGVNKLSFKDFMICLIGLLIILGSSYFIIKIEISIFKMFGPKLGIIISFLQLSLALGFSLPLIMLVYDIIEIRATIKDKRSLFVKRKASIFDNGSNNPEPTKGIHIEGCFISLYYHPDRKKLRWGYCAVALLQLLIIAGKSLLLLYVLLGHNVFFHV